MLSKKLTGKQYSLGKALPKKCAQKSPHKTGQGREAPFPVALKPSR
jgi:hypothetical protein